MSSPRKDRNLSIPQNRTLDVMAGIFGWMFEHAHIDLNNRSFLEIGTGQYINHPICAWISGCYPVTTYDIRDNLVDRFTESLKYSTFTPRFLYKFVTASHVKNRIGAINNATSWKDPIPQLKKLGIHITNSIPEEKFDVIFSYSVLEHVPDSSVEPLLNKIRRATGDGGNGIHYIDLDDPGKENHISINGWMTKFSRADLNPVTILSDTNYVVIRTEE